MRRDKEGTECKMREAAREMEKRGGGLKGYRSLKGEGVREREKDKESGDSEMVNIRSEKRTDIHTMVKKD